MTNNDFLKLLSIKRGNDFIPLTKYEKTNKKILVKHQICGNTFEITPNHLLSGRGCPFCSKTRRNYTADWFREKIKNEFPEFELLSEYKNSKTKVKIKHKLCDNIFEIRPEDFLKNKKCPICSRKESGIKRRKNNTAFKKELFNLVGDEYTLLSNYKTNKEKIKLRHNLCGTEFEVLPIAFLFSNNQREKGTRCPLCYGSTKKTDEEIKEIIESDPEYEYIPGTYKNNAEHFKIKHKTCGLIFDTLLVNYKKGCRCPHCALKSTSKKEEDLLNFIHEFFPDSQKKRFFPDKNNKRVFIEADICIEKLKLIIEFDGIYWHSTQNGKNKNYHLDKTKFFNSQGYRCIHIFEDEWSDDKKELTKRKLKHIFGVDNNEHIFGRKCFVKEINTEISSDFLNKNHIQGTAAASIKLGLFYNEKLVAVMTFGALRAALGNKNNSSKTFELVRYATNCNVIGGFGKLLKFAIENYDIEKIITYADLRWSDLKNNIYEKNNFEFVHISEPNYFYYNGMKKYHRYQFRKQVLKDKFPDLYDENLTEFQIMDKTKYLRIYDCGNIVYKLEIKNKG